jgi:hypothetical protein
MVARRFGLPREQAELVLALTWLKCGSISFGRVHGVATDEQVPFTMQTIHHAYRRIGVQIPGMEP